MRARVAYAPQELAFYPGLTVGENLELFAALTPGATRDSVAEAIRIGDLSAHLKKRAQSLSGGLKRRLNFCIALLGRPRLLCLDEPAAGLDTSESTELGRRLRGLADGGRSMLLIDHDMGLVMGVCDQITVVDHGVVIAREPDGVDRGERVHHADQVQRAEIFQAFLQLGAVESARQEFFPWEGGHPVTACRRRSQPATPRRSGRRSPCCAATATTAARTPSSSRPCGRRCPWRTPRRSGRASTTWRG